jgi:hypothetical protein
MVQTLGVATLTYAPFPRFNTLNPFVTAVYGVTGIGLQMLEESETKGSRHHDINSVS